VPKGQDTTVTVTLTPSNEEGAEWLKTHPKEALKRESIGGTSYNSDSEQALKKTPLISSLPFIDQLYRVDYGLSKKTPDDPTATAIYIKYYTEEGKTQALDWIRFKGYNPSSLEIIYQDATGS
jgi:hypothetical protein